MKDRKIIAKGFTDEVTNRRLGIQCGLIEVEVQVAQDTSKSETTTWYNAITATIRGRYGKIVASGCCHDIIRRRFPQFEDMLAIHCTDVHGAPSYPIENGLFHAIENGAKTLADYFMISEEEAEDIVRRVFRSKTERGQRQVIQNAVRKLRPRWEAKAKSVMAKYEAMPEVA